MTRAPRPGVPHMAEGVRLSPPVGFGLEQASEGREQGLAHRAERRSEFGLRRGENSPPRHEFEWPREGV